MSNLHIPTYQEQRNEFTNVLFKKIKLGSRGRIVAVKTRMEFEPFFRLSYESHVSDIAGDPGKSSTVGTFNDSGKNSLRSLPQGSSQLNLILTDNYLGI